MKLTFDPDFDHGAWPGPLAGLPGEAAVTAVAGEEWVGEAGLLGRLETALGLGGPAITSAERAASIVPEVREREGFWSASAAVDPLGTARRLLEWRDALALAGWRGEFRPSPMSPLTPWLAALAAVTAGAPAGVPDRLSAVVQSLARRSADIEEVHLLCATDELAPLWRDVLKALHSRGTHVEEIQLAAVPPVESDLHASRGAFSPRGDGSLQLVRPHGPLAAADGVAAWLSAFDAARGDLSGVVIVGADAVLDAALHRHGLPTTGAAVPARENLLLQIVPLVLALGWRPADPQRALELLTLPLGPVPPAIARRLARALHEWPAVDSDAWREALAAGLAEIPEGRRPRVAARLETLLAASVERGTAFPVPEIERRLAALDGWLRARQAVGDTDEANPSLSQHWQAPLDQVAAARRLLAAGCFETLSAAQLRWLIETATESVAVPPPHAAQAGLASVGAPGSIAGPARVIVWWRFLLDSAKRVRHLPLAPADRAALAAAGVELQDPGRAALYLSHRWRRPLLQAREHLLLIAPWRADSCGHPLH